MYIFLIIPLLVHNIIFSYLSEGVVTSSANNEEEMGTINVDDPLLRYTNHERHESKNADSAV